jgi:hypothetical protein
MPDDRTLTDAPTRAVIEHTAAWHRPHAVGMSDTGRRRAPDAMGRAFRFGDPPGVAVADEAVGGAPFRHRQPDNFPCIVNAMAALPGGARPHGGPA